MDERSWMTAGLTLVAFVIGLALPDIDLLAGVHRSGVTHSVLPALVAFARTRWRHAGCGLAGGVGVHLSADCFPRAMVGYATVKLPVESSIGAGWSYVWLGANALLALALAAWALRRLHHPVAAWGVAAGAAVFGAGYLWRDPGGWLVLAIVVVAAGVWWRWRAKGLGR
jgi:hypothetical protein